MWTLSSLSGSISNKTSLSGPQFLSRDIRKEQHLPHGSQKDTLCPFLKPSTVLFLPLVLNSRKSDLCVPEPRRQRALSLSHGSYISQKMSASYLVFPVAFKNSALDFVISIFFLLSRHRHELMGGRNINFPLAWRKVSATSRITQGLRIPAWVVSESVWRLAI